MAAALLLLLLPPARLAAPPAAPPLPAVQAGEEQEAPAVAPAEAARRIREVLKGGETDDVLLELEELGRIPHRDVVKAVARGIQHEDPAVREAALQALRFNPHPEALKALLGMARRKKLLQDPDFAREWYLALGQKGDARALKPLADGLLVSRNVVEQEVAKARILALGRIRDPKAVEAIMGVLLQGGGKRARHPYMAEIRVAMFVLTGEDQGPDMTAWIRWWNENKRRIRVLPEEPEIPDKAIRRRWREMWRDPLAEEETEEEKDVDAALGGALEHLGGSVGDAGGEGSGDGGR